MTSAKWRTFCLGLNVSTRQINPEYHKHEIDRKKDGILILQQRHDQREKVFQNKDIKITQVFLYNLN